jgi:hypothetical protein
MDRWLCSGRLHYNDGEGLISSIIAQPARNEVVIEPCETS